MSYCTRCGTELLDGALFCRNCGTRIGTSAAQPSSARKMTKTGAWSRLMFYGVLFCFVIWAAFQMRDQPPETYGAGPTIPPSPAQLKAAAGAQAAQQKARAEQAAETQRLQVQRSQLIKKYQSIGAIKRLECRDSGATLTVGAPFLLGDFEDKAAMLGVVYKYCWPEAAGRYTSVRIKESINGKEIGTFSAESGLEME